MSGPVQVLTHEYAPFRGGIARYVEELAGALGRCGAAVTVWAPDYGTGAGLERGAPGVRVRRVRMRGRQDFWCRRRLARALREAFPEGRIAGTVVLAEPGPIRMWMAAEGWGLPEPERLVLILHGSEVWRLGARRREGRALGRLLERADRVGVVSGAVGQELERRWPQMAGRWERVPGAVRSAWSGLAAESSARCDDSGDLRLLQVGRITPRKGQLLAVEALAGTGMALRVAGPVSHRGYARRVRRRAGELGVAVRWLGAVSDEQLAEEYRRAHGLLFPSQQVKGSVEGLGLVALEAAHFGCAVLASRTGGVAEAVRDGETGLLLPEGDILAWRAAMRAWAADFGEVLRMGQAGRCFVREHFSWERNARWVLGD